MIYVKRVCSALAAAAVLAAASQASAAVVDLRFEEVAGASVNTQNFGPNVYFDWQNAFHTASASGDYDFQFTYDTAAAGPNYGLTLVSGRVGSFTDFSLWTPALSFSPGASLTVQLTRGAVAGSSQYLSGVYFFMQDNDGDIPASLPTALTLANLDAATASFENRRNGGVGQGFKNIGYSRFGGTLQVPTGSGDPPGGGDPPLAPIPEPGVWAMLLLGFGATGALLRSRRRRIVAAA